MSFDARTLMVALEHGNPIPDILPTMSRQEANLSWLLAEAVWNQEIILAIPTAPAWPVKRWPTPALSKSATCLPVIDVRRASWAR